MNKKNKISELLAGHYFQAAKAECNMVRITGILEEIRTLAAGPDPFEELHDRLGIYMGQSFDNEKEFSFLKTLYDNLKILKNEFLEYEIMHITGENSDSGYQRWLELFARELSRLHFNACLSLLQIPIPRKDTDDFRFFENNIRYLKEERWDKGLPLIEYFIGKDFILGEVKADLHILAGQIHYFHFFDLPGALEHYKKAQLLIPETAKAERMFGEYHIQDKAFEKARTHLQKALDKDKNDYETYIVLGNLYKAENRYETAASWYNEGLRINPGKPDLYNRLLLLNDNPSYYSKHASEIGYLLNRIISLDPDFEYTAMNNAGFVHQKNGQYEKAEEFYFKVLEMYPGRIQSYINLGYSFLEKNEPEKSEEYFKISISRDPEAFDGYWGLVSLYRMRGDWQAVIHHLEISEKYRPQWQQYIYNEFGNAWENLGDTGKAQHYYLLALRNDPEKDLGLAALCDLAEQNPDMEAGLKLLEEANLLAGSGFRPAFHYRTGIIYYKNGDFDQATEHFKVAVDLDPKDPAKLEYLGLALEKSGNREKAEEYYRQAIKVSEGDNSRYYNRLGFFLTENGKFDEAIPILQQAVDINPEPVYFENLGYVHEFKGDYEISESYYIRALNSAVTDKDTYENRLGIYYYNRQDYERAISRYHNAIALAAKPVYYENLGLAYENSKQLRKAEESYRKAVSVAEKDKDKYLNRLAFFLSDNGRYTEAVDLLEQATQILPAANYFENLGYAYENLGEMQKAETFYKKAIEISSSDRHIYLNRLGIFFFRQEKYEEAVTFYRKAIELRPLAVYYENLGNVYNNMGNPELFEESHLKAAELEPQEGKYFFQLGWNLLHKYNDIARSKSYLNKAIEIFRLTPEIEPEELMSIQFLGAAYQQEGNLDKAEEIFMDAYELDSENEIICNFLGKVYSDKNEPERALEYYEKAYHLAPQVFLNIKNVLDVLERLGETQKMIKLCKDGATLYPELNDNLGKIYYQQLDYQHAEKYFRRAVEAYPENYIYRDNLASTLQKLKKYKEAGDEFAKALEYAPKEEEDVYLNFIGNSLFEQHLFDAAAEYYQKALELNPDAVVYVKNLIEALRSGNKREKAIEILENKLEYNPSDKDFLNMLGTLYFEMGHTEKATGCFKGYVHFHPADPLGYDNLGFCHEQAGQYQEAIEIYLKGATLDNSFYEKTGKIYLGREE